jgi:hypothetical protein
MYGPSYVYVWTVYVYGLSRVYIHILYIWLQEVHVWKQQHALRYIRILFSNNTEISGGVRGEGTYKGLVLNVSMYSCMHTHFVFCFVYARICICFSIYMCVYIYVYIYIYIHTYNTYTKTNYSPTLSEAVKCTFHNACIDPY